MEQKQKKTVLDYIRWTLTLLPLTVISIFHAQVFIVEWLLMLSLSLILIIVRWWKLCHFKCGVVEAMKIKPALRPGLAMLIWMVASILSVIFGLHLKPIDHLLIWLCILFAAFFIDKPKVVSWKVIKW